MNRTLLDTDILSEVMKQRDTNVATNYVAYIAEHGRLTVSSITVLEVVRGLRRKNREAELSSFELYGIVLATGNVAHFEAVRAVGYEIGINNWRAARPL